MTDATPVFSWLDTRALGPASAGGVIRSESADFQVDEILGFEPDGEGEHLLLWVEKTDCNTNWVAGQLARQAGLHSRDLGFSGLKDRWAITRQYFSVPASGGSCEQWLGWESEGFRVLAATRHRRKLRRGSHQGNRFQLRVRELGGDSQELERRLQAVAREGVPNYFGEQRFGRDMGNLALAQRVLSDPRRRWHRNEREFAFSAARSALFNEVLARRIREGNWNLLLPGELVMLEGSRSVFLAEDIDAALQARLASGDVGPSGPLAGESAMQAGGLAGALEQEVLEGYSHWVDGLCASRVKADRRRLVLKPQDMRWQLEEHALELSFTLPSGCFATSVLRELLNYREANRRGRET
jgi:tRNA pseudouridine13 synthase